MRSCLRSAGRYLGNRSVRTGIAVGTVFWASWAAAHDAWTDPVLAGTALFFAAALPHYARASNALEQRVQLATAAVTPGRLARFGCQLAFNLVAFGALAAGGTADLSGLHGVLGAAALTTAASQGAQMLGLHLARRGTGEPTLNVLVGLSANVIAGAAATAGLPWLASAYTAAALALGVAATGVGALSDLRAALPRRGGIGVFFGTFNPFHSTHAALAARAVRERGLEKLYVHPTGVPKPHLEWLRKGEIAARREGAWTVYERTASADALVDYFPTGNRFLSPRTRAELARAALDAAEAADPALRGRFEVMVPGADYARGGFPEVLRGIRAACRGARVHVVHGSDWGGMQVRQIVDECAAAWPLAVRRRDGVSATAIRAGADWMAPPEVRHLMAFLARSAEGDETTLNGRIYRNVDGHLVSSPA